MTKPNESIKINIVLFTFCDVITKKKVFRFTLMDFLFLLHFEKHLFQTVQMPHRFCIGFRYISKCIYHIDCILIMFFFLNI